MAEIGSQDLQGTVPLGRGGLRRQKWQVNSSLIPWLWNYPRVELLGKTGTGCLHPGQHEAGLLKSRTSDQKGRHPGTTSPSKGDQLSIPQQSGRRGPALATSPASSDLVIHGCQGNRGRRKAGKGYWAHSVLLQQEEPSPALEREAVRRVRRRKYLLVTKRPPGLVRWTGQRERRGCPVSRLQHPLPGLQDPVLGRSPRLP